MRVLLGLATLAVAALAACTPWSSAATTPSIGTAPADGASSASAEGSRPLLFALEGGFLSPLRNGGRVAIANGWIEPHFSPFPPGRRSDLDIVVVSAMTGEPAQAQVSVTYEMLDMAHGALAQHALPGMSAGHHMAKLDLSMQGLWQFKVKVSLEGTTSITVLVLTESEP